MVTRSNFYTVMAQVKPFLSGVTVLGLDTSAILQRLTNVREFPISIVTTSSSIQNRINIPDVEVVLVNEPISAKDIIIIDGLSCTSPERTIIDLLRYDRDPQVIVESLARYYHSGDLGSQEESWGDLPSLLRKYHLYEDFEMYIEDAEDFYAN